MPFCLKIVFCLFHDFFELLDGLSRKVDDNMELDFTFKFHVFIPNEKRSLKCILNTAIDG